VQRVLLHRVEEEVHEGSVLPECEARLCELLDCLHVELFESRDFRGDRAQTVSIGERGSAPQLQRVGELVRRARRVADIVGFARGTHQRFETLGVELRKRDAQHVTRRRQGEPNAGRGRGVLGAVRLERAANLRDVRAQRAGRRCGRVTLPQLVDQDLGL